MDIAEAGLEEAEESVGVVDLTEDAASLELLICSRCIVPNTDREDQN